MIRESRYAPPVAYRCQDCGTTFYKPINSLGERCHDCHSKLSAERASKHMKIRQELRVRNDEPRRPTSPPQRRLDPPVLTPLYFAGPNPANPGKWATFKRTSSGYPQHRLDFDTEQEAQAMADELNRRRTGRP